MTYQSIWVSRVIKVALINKRVILEEDISQVSHHPYDAVYRSIAWSQRSNCFTIEGELSRQFYFNLLRSNLLYIMNLEIFWYEHFLSYYHFCHFATVDFWILSLHLSLYLKQYIFLCHYKSTQNFANFNRYSQPRMLVYDQASMPFLDNDCKLLYI